ncbi:peptidase S8/S53 domain-containing protein [Xylaria bambusicola]|uniref:peptidase S8/S53 domain-containing protein n=1 Tax=Xylaria bambusicola TaxID=326684 RepID=UPI002007315E|nr:peptidase S8/S53 domain-containing protein [Xylaria bambusicola]KAI0505318.1 peptidase S8/S53 domain-containing protein [Xylaria bambusicola]
MKIAQLLFVLGLAAYETIANPLNPYPDALQRETSQLLKRVIPRTHVRHEKRTSAQGSAWSKVERAKREALLPMRIGFKQSNLMDGHNLLMDISNPKSKNYGKHLSAEEVVDFFAPLESSVQVVKNWLIEAGVEEYTISQSANKQWIQFDAPVNQIEDLLMTNYHVWEHKLTGTKDIGCDEYHIPKNVASHVDYITPGVKLMGNGGIQHKHNRERSSSSEQSGFHKFQGSLPFVEPVRPQDILSGNLTLAQGCDTYVTPDCIRQMYGIPKGNTSHASNKMGIFQSLKQHYTQQDLDAFFWAFTDGIPNGTHPELLSVNGGEGATTELYDAGTESNLDFQMAYGLIWPQEPALFQVDDEWYQQSQLQSGEYAGFFNNLWNAIDGSYCTFEAFGEKGNCKRPECKDPEYPNQHEGGYKGELNCGIYKPTNVISISYSGAESELPASYQQRQCAEIMKLGLQGSTIMIASGDSGVAGFATYANPSGCMGPNHDVFNPQFLATCPYILSVGSTYLPTNKTAGKDGEVATSRFRSGGGFSNIYDAPEWQRDTVAQYLVRANLSFEGYEGGGKNYSNAKDGIGRFNRIGRAYPDVSANGDRFVISSGGELLRIGGTSASCPLWGSIITLINEARLEAGKKPVGFIHPILYAHPEVFNDITVGDNRGCRTTGFPATPGWDPVTGMGTPNYPKLLELFTSLP